MALEIAGKFCLNPKSTKPRIETRLQCGTKISHRMVSTLNPLNQGLKLGHPMANEYNELESQP